MSYENAASTKMIATCCAVCGRPLVDAVSVETGMGPECRRKHGYGVAQMPADWTAARAALAGLAIPSSCFEGLSALVSELNDDDAHKLANRLVHQLALSASGVSTDPANVRGCVNAIAALGFVKLGAVLAARLATVQISNEGDEIVVRAPYSPESVEAFRAVHGRRWNAADKSNRFPTGSAAAIFDALKRAYPGRYANGPKGLFFIPAAA